jgi:hypothetical protein
MHTLLCSENLIWLGYVACTGEMRNEYITLFRKLEGKRPLKRPRCKWENNVGMDIRE